MNHLVILANNMTYLRILVDNLPQLEEEILFTVVTETRIGDKTNEIKEILDSSDKLKHYSILTDKPIIEKLKEEVVDTDFVDNYVMGLKILIPWYFFKTKSNLDKLFVMDEDIIITKNPAELFKFKEHSFFKLEDKYTAKNVAIEKLSQSNKKVFEFWFSIFNEKLNQNFFNEYLSIVPCGGTLLLVKNMFNIKDYEDILKKFYLSNILKEYWNQRSRNSTQLLDEMFFATIFKNYLNNNLNEKVKNYDNKIFTKNDFNSYILLHVASTNQKLIIYDKLIRDKLIKGKRLSIPKLIGIERYNNINI